MAPASVLKDGDIDVVEVRDIYAFLYLVEKRCGFHEDQEPKPVLSFLQNMKKEWLDYCVQKEKKASIALHHQDLGMYETETQWLTQMWNTFASDIPGVNNKPSLLQNYKDSETFQKIMLTLPEKLVNDQVPEKGFRDYVSEITALRAREKKLEAKDQDSEKEKANLKRQLLEKNEEMLDIALKASGSSSELQEKLDAYKASGGTKLTDKVEEEIKERQAKEVLNGWYRTTEQVDYISKENDVERKEKLEKGKILLFVGRDPKEGPANAPMKFMFNIQFGTGGAVKVGFMSRKDAIGNKVEKLQGEAETTTEKGLKGLIDDATSAESANSMLYDAHMKAEMEGELKESNPWMQRAAFEFLQRQAYINLKEANTEQRMADYSKQERKDKCECGYMLATSDTFCPSCGRSSESKEITIYRLVNGGKAI